MAEAVLPHKKWLRRISKSDEVFWHDSSSEGFSAFHAGHPFKASFKIPTWWLQLKRDGTPTACTAPYMALHRKPPEKAAVVGVVVAVDVTVVTSVVDCVVVGVLDGVVDAVVVKVVVGVFVVDVVVECSVVVVLVVGSTAHSATLPWTCASTSVFTMPTAELHPAGIEYR